MSTIYRVVPENIYQRFIKGKFEDENETPTTETSINLDFFIAFFPKQMKSRSMRILHALHNNINNSGQLIYRNRAIPNSHIVDLILFSLKTLPNKRTDIPGLKEFFDIIKEKNIPRELFSQSFNKMLSSSKPPVSWISFEDGINP